MKRFSVQHASPADVLWLMEMLNREGKRFGTGVKIEQEATLKLWW